MLRTFVHHHAGELIQGPIVLSGRIVVALMTLRMTQFRTFAAFQPTVAGGVRVVPTDKRKAQGAANLFLDFLRKWEYPGADLNGHLEISNPSLPVGRGFGTSSADVLVTLKAMALALGVEESEVFELILAFAKTAEGAVDPLILEGDVLFAPREGQVLKRYEGSVPRFNCLGGELGIAVDTNDLALRQRGMGFSANHVVDFAVVEALLDQGLRKHDLGLISKAARLSARLNQEQISLPKFDEVLSLAEALEVGLAISHSGSAFSLLIDPLDPYGSVKMATARDRLIEIGISKFIEFTNR
jgi:uncharacterized protein involved in propanediol utilization